MIVTKEEERQRMVAAVGSVCARWGCDALRLEGSRYCMSHQLKAAAAGSGKAERKKEVLKALKGQQVRVAQAARGNCDLCGYAISTGDEYRAHRGVAAHQLCFSGAAALIGGGN